jgi:hypothetical protein
MTVERRPSLRVPSWLAYLAVGALAVAVHAAMETGSLAQSFLYDIIGASAVAVALIGVRLHRPDRVASWVAIALGQALFVAGDLAWNYFEVVPSIGRPALGQEPG